MLVQNASVFSKEDVRLYKDGSSSAAGDAFKNEFIKGKGLKLTFVTSRSRPGG
jgi:hypothetical protein